MLVISPLSAKARDMTGLTWLFCNVLLLNLLVGQSLASAGKEKSFGDVTEEEVAIDHLEDYLQGRNAPENFDPNLGSHLYDYNVPDFHSTLKLDEKIEFAVPPRDPRYFLPSSVLRTGELPTYGFVPSEDMTGKSSDLAEAHPPSPLLQELYSRFTPGLYEDSVELDGGNAGGGPNGFYKGHKFGPRPEGFKEDSETESKERDSVNFLQESRHQAQVPQYFVQQPDGTGVISDFYFVALVSGCTAAAVCAVVGAGICYLRLHKSKRDAADAEYPAYGVTGPNKDFSPAAADRKLAQSAHMFHYQHQKQQMIALEKSSGDERHCSTSDVDSEEEGEEGDYTVYECPGLAPTDEMEVKNPLFSDDPTPATPARKKKGENDTNEGGEEEDEEEED